MICIPLIDPWKNNNSVSNAIETFEQLIKIQCCELFKIKSMKCYHSFYKARYFYQGNLYTGGRGWYRMCSCQPTVLLACKMIFSLAANITRCGYLCLCDVIRLLEMVVVELCSRVPDVSIFVSWPIYLGYVSLLLTRNDCYSLAT